MRIAGLCLVFLLSLVLTACQYDPFAESFLTEKPNTKDIIGIYLLKSQTLIPGGLAFMSGKSSKLVLLEDGTFHFANYPRWDNVGSKWSVRELVTVNGKWTIENIGGNEAVQYWGLNLDMRGDWYNHPSVHFTRGKPSYGLLLQYGDPDSGDVMIFEKSNVD